MKSADHALFASFYALAAVLAGFSTIAFAALASPVLAVSAAILAALLGLSASRELSAFRSARMIENQNRGRF